MIESAFIETLRGLATHPAARGLADDCAVLELGDQTLVVTHDSLVEGVHFLPGQDPADIAWKLVATNLSDLAAKGAEPLGVLLGYQLGKDDARFVEGLEEVLTHYGVPLLGGDTVSGTGGAQVLGLTAIGRATHCPVPLRSGARPGDGLYVTGAIGAALAGFEALQAGSGDALPYTRPLALLAEGWALAPVVTAMMDVSDGLLIDARRLAEASGVTLSLEGAAVPIALPKARREEALRWGDDYQLLFTLPPSLPPPVSAARIGTVETRSSAPLLVDGAEPHGPLGYEHGSVAAS